MAKKSDQKTYKPLSYVGLDGDLKEIVPSGEFKIIKDGYSKSYSCGETYSATDERLIEHAIRLISTKPNFIESEGVEWNLSYVAHIRDMFSEFLNGTCGPEHIPEIALNAVKVKRNLIYTTRLCSAAKLLNQIVNGGYLQGSSDIREVVGIVARESRRWSDESLACKIEKLCGYFESGGFKSSMTRSYFKGTLVKFKIPEGALLRVKFEAGHRDLPSGLEMTIRLKEFPFGYYPKS